MVRHRRFDPFLTRRLTRIRDGAAVTVEIARPQPRRTGEFQCEYRVRGMGRVKRGRALGEDSLQAVQLAIEALRLALEPHAKELTWLGEPGELGLPKYVPWWLGAAFSSRLAAILEREIEREASRLGSS